MSDTKLKIVLDTNVFIVSLSSHFKYYPIYKSLIDAKYELFLSNEVLLEYEEQIVRRYGLERTASNLQFLFLLPNINLNQIYYNWNLIQTDPDDNKFVDLAVNSNADYIVSNDKSFKILKEIDFPKVNIISATEFLEIIKGF